MGDMTDIGKDAKKQDAVMLLDTHSWLGRKTGGSLGDRFRMASEAASDTLEKASQKVHVKAYTRMVRGKAVQVKAHEAGRVKKADYVEKTRGGPKDMWHYTYKDKKGTFEHYHPPFDHKHISIYRRDVRRASAHAKKHGAHVPADMRHDPQGMFLIGEDARMKEADRRSMLAQQRTTQRKARRANVPKNFTPEDHPNWFTDGGEKLVRPYPDNGINVHFNENPDLDFYAR